MELKDRLARERIARKLSQTQLAARAGLKNQSIIGMLESGARKKSGYLPQIAHALGVDALWLASGKGLPDVHIGSRVRKLDPDEVLVIEAFRRFGPELRDAWLVMAKSVLTRDDLEPISAQPGTKRVKGKRAA